MGYLCRMNERKLQHILVVFICVLFASGCSRNDPSSRIGEMNDTRIKQLANLYMAHQTRNGSNGPKDEKAFKDFIQHGMAPHRLEMMRVDPTKVDDLVISERDGQPFVIKYGQSGGIMSKLPVVFAKEGKAGKRQVGFTNGQVEEVDDLRYQELLQSGKSVGASAGAAK